MNHWPSGGRDTTEFPQVQIDVESSFRNHLEAFCKLDGIGWNSYDKQLEVSGLKVEPSRLRTYRKLYQNLGLIFKDDETLRLSKLGNSLCSLTENIKKSRDENLVQIAKIAVDILSRYQIDNPTESQRAELPANCDVLPCICIWKAMLKLDGKLHYEELNRVLLHVMKMDELDNAIEKISIARKKCFPYQDQTPSVLDECMGIPVHSDQPSARIAPWFSFAGWGGLLIDRNVDSDHFRNLAPNSVPLIKRAVKEPPTYFKTDDEEEWYKYYIGSAAHGNVPQLSDITDLSDIVSDFSIDVSLSNLKFNSKSLLRFIASCLTKRFVILTGLSGSGKTKLAEAFASWITEAEDQYRLVAVGADWTSNENVLGYPDALQEGVYRKPSSGSLDLILRARDDANRPYFLILDEMNLSHVERYFADILSAIESSSKDIALHSSPAPMNFSEGEIPVPDKISLPNNLFIIGTVNVDETTYMFSPKVLDRANVIEFRATQEEIENFLDAPARVQMEKLAGKGAGYGLAFVETANAEVSPSALSEEIADGAKISEDLKTHLIDIFGKLAPIGAEFGFRTAIEITRFVYYHASLTGAGWDYKDALDAQVIQKLMPKLHGSDRKLRPTLETLKEFCTEYDLGLSLEKTNRMLERLKDGFTSFAEA